MTLLLNGWRSGRSASSHERESSFHLAQDSQEKQLKDRNNRKLETLFAQVQTQKKQITLQDGKLLFSVWSFAEMATIIITIITTACRIPAKAKPGTNKKHMTSLPFVRKKKMHRLSARWFLLSSFFRRLLLRRTAEVNTWGETGVLYTIHFLVVTISMLMMLLYVTLRH